MKPCIVQITKKGTGGGGGGSPTTITPLLDLSGVPSDPIFAVSARRKLRAAYAGSIYRLLDLGDASTHDIGFSDGDVSMADLVAACNTNTVIYSMDRWYDQGSAGNDLTQSTTSAMPQIKYGTVGQSNASSYRFFTGGYPAPQFDGGDQLVSASMDFPEGSLYAAFVVSCNDWYFTAYQGLLGIATGPTSGVGIWARTGGPFGGWLTGDAVAVGNGYNAGREPRVHDGFELLSVQYGTPVILEFLLQDGGNDEIRINGVTAIKEANSAIVPALTSQILHLGYIGSGTDFLQGQLGEAALWMGEEGTDVPNAAARNLIFENLNAVFNTTQLTPDTWS